MQTANAETRYTVTAQDLPLCCPMPGMSLWNSHPRVYLPIEQTGWAKCGYCGAEYTLAGAATSAATVESAAQAAVQR